MMFVECYCGGLCRRMVGIFWTHISTMAGVVMARWCWKYVQLCKAFWMSIINVVKRDRTNSFWRVGLPRSSPCWGPGSGSILRLSRWVFSSMGRWCQLSPSLEEPVAPTDVLPVPASVACWSPALFVILLSTWVLPLSSSCPPKPECLDESIVSADIPAHSE